MLERGRNDLGEQIEVVSDHLLLKRLRAGEEDAATKLYLRYAKRLQALASAQTSSELKTRFDPEDVVQSVFRTFFRRVSHGMYDVPAGEELWQLLLVLALNKIRKLATYHRAKKRDVRKTQLAERLGPAAPDARSHDETSLLILRLLVTEVLDELTPSQRRIVELRIDGHAADEICQRTNRSKRTVERVLQRFRLKLSGLIHDSSNDPDHE